MTDSFRRPDRDLPTITDQKGHDVLNKQYIFKAVIKCIQEIKTADITPAWQQVICVNTGRRAQICQNFSGAWILSNESSVA